MLSWLIYIHGSMNTLIFIVNYIQGGRVHKWPKKWENHHKVWPLEHTCVNDLVGDESLEFDTGQHLITKRLRSSLLFNLINFINFKAKNPHVCCNGWRVLHYIFQMRRQLWDKACRQVPELFSDGHCVVLVNHLNGWQAASAATTLCCRELCFFPNPE